MLTQAVGARLASGMKSDKLWRTLKHNGWMRMPGA